MNSNIKSLNNHTEDNFLAIRSFSKAFIVRGFELLLVGSILTAFYFYYPNFDFRFLLTIAILVVSLISFIVYKSLVLENIEETITNEPNRENKIPLVSRMEEMFAYSIERSLGTFRGVLITLFSILIFFAVDKLLIAPSNITSEGTNYIVRFTGNILIGLFSLQILVEVITHTLGISLNRIKELKDSVFHRYHE